MALDDATARAPKLDRDLVNSAKADFVDDDTVRISFGTDYAVKQNFKDMDHPNGGERFFLNSAMDDLRPRIEQVLADELRQAFGS